jgi:Uncharacterised protein family (UPF0158)
MKAEEGSMSEKFAANKEVERPLREVPVDWEALEDAFENNAPEVHSYLHLATGEVLRVVDGVADPQMHVRIASDAQYLRIDPVSSREQYRWMERFIPMVEIAELKDKLYVAIDGKGAFRRFKDILMTYASERERWFNFRSERLKTFMAAWLEAHAIKAAVRPPWADSLLGEEGGSRETASAASLSDASLTSDLANATPLHAPGAGVPFPAADAPRSQSGRKNRSADYMRHTLRDLAEQLGTRELDALLSFGEFLKTRRIARDQVAAERDESARSMPESTPDLQRRAQAPAPTRDSWPRETLLGGGVPEPPTGTLPGRKRGE